MDKNQAMVLAFAQWGAAKSGKDPQTFMQEFQTYSDQQKQQMLQAFQSDPEAQKYIQAAQQQLSGGTQVARLGAKLNYIKQIKGDCPEGEELVYFKKGGRFCKACRKKQEGGNVDEIANFKKQREEKKCGGKMKECGGKMENNKCGGKMKDACGGKMEQKCGGKMENNKCGGKMKDACGGKMKEEECGGKMEQKCGGKMKKKKK